MVVVLGHQVVDRYQSRIHLRLLGNVNMAGSSLAVAAVVGPCGEIKRR